MEIACAAAAAAAACLPGDETTIEQFERLEVSSIAQTSSAVASSTDDRMHIDSVDPQSTKAAISHLQQKILKLTEQIKIAQTAWDENVAEYLKLANSADKQQAVLIKQVFAEKKKNQKSAQISSSYKRSWSTTTGSPRSGAEWDPLAAKGCLQGHAPKFEGCGSKSDWLQ